MNRLDITTSAKVIVTEGRSESAKQAKAYGIRKVSINLGQIALVQLNSPKKRRTALGPKFPSNT